MITTKLFGSRIFSLATRCGKVSRISIAMLAALLFANGSASAVTYSFMTVSGTNVPGNGTTVSTFQSTLNGSSIITVDHFSNTPNSLGNWGTADNINSAVIPSEFKALFGPGNVQGHIAQSMYGDPSPPPGFPAPIPNVTTVTFNLTAYQGSLPNLLFGIWNTTTDVGFNIYNLQLMNSGGMFAPTMMTVFGRDENTGSAGVPGKYLETFNPVTGDISYNPSNPFSGGIHTDALFLMGIPSGTQKIIVTGTLPALNNLGDGVGYYFVETPEPSTIVLGSLGMVGVLIAARRRRIAMAA